MHVIADYYNRVYAAGWVADWTNKNQNKWFCAYRTDSSKVYISFAVTHASFHIYFASERLAQMAYENNEEIFETALKP